MNMRGGTFECLLCARNYNLRSGLDGHILNYHKKGGLKKKNLKVAGKKSTDNLRLLLIATFVVNHSKPFIEIIHTKSSCLASVKPKKALPTPPETIPLLLRKLLEEHDESLSFEIDTMYSFDAYKNIVIMDDFEMAKSIKQNSKRDPTPTESTALSDKDQNTSQSDHQFRRPEVPSLRHYRHPTASGLNSNRGNVLTSNTYVIGGVVNTTGGVIVGDEDLGNGYVYADENIWNYYH